MSVKIVKIVAELEKLTRNNKIQTKKTTNFFLNSNNNINHRFLIFFLWKIKIKKKPV